MEPAEKDMVADTLAQTKGLGDSVRTRPDAAATTETVKEGMTLIDRFYNGGNQARPGVADILVLVLDQVIGRMRQRNANAQATIDRCNAECAQLDTAIGRIMPKFKVLDDELNAKKARAEELRRDIKDGTDCMTDSVAIAKEALHKAKVVTKKQTEKYNREMKTLEKGFDGTGQPLPGAAQPSLTPPWGPCHYDSKHTNTRLNPGPFPPRGMLTRSANPPHNARASFTFARPSHLFRSGGKYAEEAAGVCRAQARGHGQGPQRSCAV